MARGPTGLALGLAAGLVLAAGLAAGPAQADAARGIKAFEGGFFEVAREEFDPVISSSTSPAVRYMTF